MYGKTWPWKSPTTAKANVNAGLIWAEKAPNAIAGIATPAP